MNLYCYLHQRGHIFIYTVLILYSIGHETVNQLFSLYAPFFKYILLHMHLLSRCYLPVYSVVNGQWCWSWYKQPNLQSNNKIALELPLDLEGRCEWISHSFFHFLVSECSKSPEVFLPLNWCPIPNSIWHRVTGRGHTQDINFRVNNSPSVNVYGRKLLLYLWRKYNGDLWASKWEMLQIEVQIQDLLTLSSYRYREHWFLEKSETAQRDSIHRATDRQTQKYKHPQGTT